MSKRLKSVACFLMLASSFALGQSLQSSGATPTIGEMPELPLHLSLPVLAPEVALQTFLKRSAEQNAEIASYDDQTTVTAELPDTKQRGEYQLQRVYTAQPKSLAFAKGHFEGDGFVKTNVITRLLQSEVDHVEKDDGSTALDFKNYKFYYKGMENIEGHDLHVFQVKPRRKDPGLFKGKFYLDVHTSSLRRMEGTFAKSPSFFVKNIEFVQDFDDIEGFTFPTSLKSSAKARIVGRTLVKIIHRDYHIHRNSGTADALANGQSMR